MFDSILPLLKQHQSFSLISHISPDGDTLGSTIALGRALSKMGKSVEFLCKDMVPDFYDFLPYSNRYTVNTGTDTGILSDVCICIDCSDLERTGLPALQVSSIPHLINIDHHTSNTHYGNYNIVDPKAAATGEIIFNLINTLGISIDDCIANCLYVAISSDTGSFRYENTTSLTHTIISKLLAYGADSSGLSTLLYGRRSISKTKLLSQALSTLEILNNGLVSLIYITQEMIEKVDAHESDSEGIINYAKEIDGIEVALLINERNHMTHKISLRSQKYIDVSAIAGKFAGGGHIRAAGCTLQGEIGQVKERLLKAVEEEFGRSEQR